MRASAPGKIILSGEHSVVYSSPAIISAISLRSHCQIKKSDNLLFNVNLKDLNISYSLSIQQLKELYKQSTNDFNKFLNSELDISAVIKEKKYYPALVLAGFLDKYNILSPQSCSIEITSEIPFGSGLGSSSALTISVLEACATFYNCEINPADFLELSKGAESLHSGKPSGADTTVSYHGGIVKFKSGNITKLEELNCPEFVFVHTGIPETSTGEAVMQVSKQYSYNSEIWTDFTAVTEQFEKALRQNNLAELIKAIKSNHRLLVKIGVVSSKVQEFVAELEDTGGAAKVCGAGSVDGEAGGVLLALGSDSKKIAEKYSYKILNFKLNEVGARID